MKKMISILFSLVILSRCVTTQNNSLNNVLLTKSSKTKSNWEYTFEKDKMNDSISRFAELKSKKSLDLDFPYQGSNFGNILIRKKANKPFEAIFLIQQGQLMCYSFQPCEMLVRFDDEAPVRYSASGSNDPGTTTVAFINDEISFIEKLTTAKKILISMPIYGNGTQVLEFETPTPLE